MSRILLSLTIAITIAHFSVLTVVCSSAENNQRPVIGIFTLPSTFGPPYTSQFFSYFGGSYVQYLESAGAQVIPLLYDYDENEMDFLLRRVNGVLFPGGDPSLWADESKMSGFSDMTLSAMRIINWAKQQNDQGNHFPLWGTCLGLEIMLMAVTNDDHILNIFEQPNDSAELQLTQNPYSTQILHDLEPSIVSFIQENNVAYYAHKYGKLIDEFNENEKLYTFFKVDATSFDKRGQRFVALIEGIKYPFFGSQFHPEVQIFQNRPGLDTNHLSETIEFSQSLAHFFVAQCRLNSHTFSDFAAFNIWSIYNYKPEISPDDFYNDVYFFENANITSKVSSVRANGSSLSKKEKKVIFSKY